MEACFEQKPTSKIQTWVCWWSWLGNTSVWFYQQDKASERLSHQGIALECIFLLANCFPVWMLSELACLGNVMCLTCHWKAMGLSFCRKKDMWINVLVAIIPLVSLITWGGRRVKKMKPWAIQKHLPLALEYFQIPVYPVTFTHRHSPVPVLLGEWVV